MSDRAAFHTARRLTREEGLFVGGSSGLNVALAVDVAREADDPGALVVCILADTGERYLSKFYNDEWLSENQLLEPDRMTAGDLLARKDRSAPALVSIPPDALTREALALITGHDISQLPVCVGDECIGSLAEAYLMARVIENPSILDQPVSEFMDDALPLVDAQAAVSHVGRMLTRQTPAVLVKRNGHLAGILTRYDVVRYLTG